MAAMRTAQERDMEVEMELGPIVGEDKTFDVSVDLFLASLSFLLVVSNDDQ
jgi:hypothetical protein